MDDSLEHSILPEEQPPKIDPAWSKKIDAEMAALYERIPVVAKQPSTEDIWCITGDLRYWPSGYPTHITVTCADMA